MDVKTPAAVLVLLEKTSTIAVPPVPRPVTAMFEPIPVIEICCDVLPATKLYHTSSSAEPPHEPATPELVALTRLPVDELPPPGQVAVSDKTPGVIELALAALSFAGGVGCLIHKVNVPRSAALA